MEERTKFEKDCFEHVVGISEWEYHVGKEY